MKWRFVKINVYEYDYYKYCKNGICLLHCVRACVYLNACMDDQSMKTKQMDMCHPL